MLKTVGIITLIIVCGLAGIKFSEKVRQRHKKLGEFTLLIEEIADRIRTGANLFDIFEGDKAKALVEINGLEMKIKQDALNEKDRSILKEFFLHLGKGDTDAETHRCSVYLELIKKQEKEAENDEKNKAGLYSKLGFFTGLFIAVVLV